MNAIHTAKLERDERRILRAGRNETFAARLQECLMHAIRPELFGDCRGESGIVFEQRGSYLPSLVELSLWTGRRRGLPVELHAVGVDSVDVIGWGNLDSCVQPPFGRFCRRAWVVPRRRYLAIESARLVHVETIRPGEPSESVKGPVDALLIDELAEAAEAEARRLDDLWLAWCLENDPAGG